MTQSVEMNKHEVMAVKPQIVVNVSFNRLSARPVNWFMHPIVAFATSEVEQTVKKVFT